MPPNEKPQGTPDQPGQGSGDEPKYVTEEQLNRAISARFSTFEKKIEKANADAITTLGAKLDEFKASLPQPQQPPPGGEGAGKQADIENHPFVKGLLKRLDDQSKATEQIKNERDAEKQRSRDQSLRGKLSDALTKGGIDPRYVRHAVGVLVDAEKRVRFSADDSEDIVFKDVTGDVDLETGLKGWLKGDDAKIFMPPRGTQGSGERRDGKPPGQQTETPSVGRALLGMAMNTITGGSSSQ